MSSQGKYNPIEPTHISTLFSFGEVPLASNKLNTWNGNIEASLNWAVQCLTILTGGRQEPFILDEGSGLELQVAMTNPPGLAVRIQAGKTMVSGCFAGLDVETYCPQAGTIALPESNPRYDVIYLDCYGKAGIKQGSESSTPVPPTPPANTVTLAWVYLRPGMSQILDVDDGANGFIVDKRPRLIIGIAHQHNTDRTPVESCDGTRTQFTTEKIFVENSLEVYVNGLLQSQGVSFTPNEDRSGYTFSSAPPAGYRIEHRYIMEK